MVRRIGAKAGDVLLDNIDPPARDSDVFSRKLTHGTTGQDGIEFPTASRPPCTEWLARFNTDP
ncbi:MAG TPA: hypothetical protein VGJ05_12570 [Fimbriiglobus sp.]